MTIQAAAQRKSAWGDSMADEPIPLYEGESSNSKIVHEQPANAQAFISHAARSKRSSVRKSCDRTKVCFSPQESLGRAEHVECPVIDLSATGLAVEFDKPLASGVSGHVAYWTVGHRPVRVSCTVRRCIPMDNGHFLIGLKLDRKLTLEEKKPAKTFGGREIAMGLRPRKLKPAIEQPEAESPNET